MIFTRVFEVQGVKRISCLHFEEVLPLIGKEMITSVGKSSKFVFVVESQTIQLLFF